jgi:hypothetical protein
MSEFCEGLLPNTGITRLLANDCSMACRAHQIDVDIHHIANPIISAAN